MKAILNNYKKQIFTDWNLLKINKFLIYLLVFLLPWQARIFLKSCFIKNEYFEYGSVHFYILDILIFLIIIISAVNFKQNFFKIKNKKIIIIFLFLFMYLFFVENKFIHFYYLARLFEYILLANSIIKSKVNTLKLSMVFIASGFLQAIVAILQFLGQNDLFSENKFLGVSSHNASQPGVSVVQTRHKRWLRSYGLLPHPNMLGGFLGAALILAIDLFLRFNRKKSDLIKELFYKKDFFENKVLSNIVYITFLIIIAVLVLGLFFTFSRSAFLAFVIIFLIYSFYRFIINKKDKTLTLFFQSFKSLVLLFLVLIFVLGYFYYPLIITRFDSQSRLEKKSLLQRNQYMKSAAEMIKKNNLTGVGLGNYVFEVINKTNVGYPAWYYQPVHNIYILLIAELGLAGVILLMFLFYNFIKRIIHFFYINKGTKDIVCFFLIFYIIIIGFFDHYFLTLYFGQLLLLIIFVLYYKKIKTFP